MGDSKEKGKGGAGGPVGQPADKAADTESFQFTVDVKGFPKENIHIHTDGPTVIIECDQTVKMNENKELKVAGGKEQKLSNETKEKTLLKTTTLPVGTDMDSVQTNLDMAAGVVTITGNYSPQKQPEAKAKEVAKNTRNTLTFDKDLFKLTVTVKGFRQENIHVKREGRRVYVDCRQVEELKSNQLNKSTEGKGQANKLSTDTDAETREQETTRVFHFSTLLPDGTELNSVNTKIDVNEGLVIFTGRALPV